MRSFTRLLKRAANSSLKTAPMFKNIGLRQLPFTFLKLNHQFSTSQASQAHNQNVLKSNYDGKGFYVQQMLVGCLAIYSYYIESNGQAFIIDPQNDITKYNELLKNRNAKLKGVFLTHYHADYIAGHGQLQKLHNCQVYLGPNAVQQKGVTVLKDGEKIKLGNVQLQCIHTPGHTQESSCLLVHNNEGKQEVLFTGDTVFLNQVGRPDLAVKTNLSAKDLAQLLYQSVQKVKKLQDSVRIYPGHGSGSACGKSIGAGDFCDLGTQKKNNYALKQLKKSQFVDQVLKQMPSPPAYFGYNARLNKFDQFNYQQAFKKANTKLSLEQLNKLKKSGIKVIDVREVKQLNSGIINGAICIDFNGGFATWVGTLIDPTQQIILFGSQQTVIQAIKRLLRIGYINIKGYSTFQIQQWKSKGLPTYNPQWVDSVFETGRTVLDVRKPNQWKTGIADTSNHVRFQLSDLFKNVQKLDKSKKYIVHCKSGYRARIAYSFLKSNNVDVKIFCQDVEKIGKFRQI